MAKKMPIKVQQKADVVLTKYKRGLINARKSKNRGYLSLEVGRDWRLLSKDGGKSFELMSHETYNRQIDN